MIFLPSPMSPIPWNSEDIFRSCSASSLSVMEASAKMIPLWKLTESAGQALRFFRLDRKYVAERRSCFR